MTDDDVVDHVDADDSSDFQQAFGDCEVCVQGFRLATGVIVHHHEREGGAHDSDAKYVAWMR